MESPRSTVDTLERVSPYWRLTLFWKGQYPLYWIVVATIGLVLFELITEIYNERHYFWTSSLVAYAIFAALPAGHLYGLRLIRRIPQTFGPLSTWPLEKFHGWFLKEANRVVGWRNWGMWASALAVNVLGSLTLISTERPFATEFLNYYTFTAIQPAFFLCGHAAYFLIAGLVLEYRLVRLPLPRIPFEHVNRSIYTLTNYTYFLTAIGLIEYAALVVAIRLGPYQEAAVMRPWISVLAFAPIGSFTFSIYQVHVLLREVKLARLESISTEVRWTFDDFKSNPSTDRLERAGKAMELHREIERSPEWPFALNTVLALTATLFAVADGLRRVVLR